METINQSDTSGREYLVKPDLGYNTAPIMSVNLGDLVSSELHILSSKELMERVVAGIKCPQGEQANLF